MSPPAKDVKEAEEFVRKALSHFADKKPNERAIKNAARSVALALMPSRVQINEETTA